MFRSKYYYFNAKTKKVLKVDSLEKYELMVEKYGREKHVANSELCLKNEKIRVSTVGLMIDHNHFDIGDVG